MQQAEAIPQGTSKSKSKNPGGNGMSEVLVKYRGTREYALVYSEMISAARYRGVTTYQAVAQIMGLPLTGNYMGHEVGQLIGEISRDEIQNGRPMLSALVVGTSGVPGDGFYTWAKELGRFKDDSRQTNEQFWRQELEAVYATWKREFKE
jgi:hypothetical protein